MKPILNVLNLILIKEIIIPLILIGLNWCFLQNKSNI
jgi:hypothetical protein